PSPIIPVQPLTSLFVSTFAVLEGSSFVSVCESAWGPDADRHAKGTTLIRSHQLPLAAGQPDAAHPAHRCLLAATRPACRHPEVESAAAHRGRHASSASLEDRQPYHRAREPHSYRARLMLPGGRDVSLLSRSSCNHLDHKPAGR